MINIRKSELRNHFLALIFFTILTLVYFIPFCPITKITDRIYWGDALQHAWAPLWFCRAILKGLPLFDANVLAPYPNSLAWSEGDFGVGAQYFALLPFSRNPVLNYHILNYMSFILAGYGAWLLIRELYPRADKAALFGGIVFAFNCFRGYRAIGHLTILQTHWLPFSTFFLARSLKNAKWVDLAGFGVTTCFIFLSNFYLTVIVSAFYALFLTLLIIFKYFKLQKRHLWIVLVMILAAIIEIPFLLPYMKMKTERFHVIDSLNQYSADIGGYLLPPFYKGRFVNLISSLLYQKGGEKKHVSENCQFIGYLVLLLVLLKMGSFMKRRWRKEKFTPEDKMEGTLMVCALVFFLFSLGPALWISDRIVFHRMPYYYVYKYLAPIRFMRAISRYAIIYLLSFSVLCGAGLQLILEKLKKRYMAWGVFLFLSIYTFGAEYYFYGKYELCKVTDNPIFAWLKEKKKQGRHYNILVLPFRDRRAILESTYHWHSVTEGNYFPPNYTQDISSAQEWNPPVVFLLEKYKVDMILTRSSEIKEKIGKTPFVDKVLEYENRALFRIKKEEFRKSLEEEKKKREEIYRRSKAQSIFLISEKQIRNILAPDKKRWIYHEDTGNFEIKILTGSIILFFNNRNPFSYSTLRFTMKAWSEVDDISPTSLYWHASEESGFNEKLVQKGKIFLDGKEHVYEFNLKNHYQWLYYGNIKSLRLDFIQGKGNRFRLKEICLLP
ncbi:hypothetical protein JW926_11705 [Candidatus Sumerlaeota bacterium]|nr:hypothetical protein [Candidatus Sumerlaeota bacterium]